MQEIRVSGWAIDGCGLADSVADLQIFTQKAVFLRLNQYFYVVILLGRTIGNRILECPLDMVNE